ncbi:MAG: DUF4982 domain-containing protein [Bacteroidaceae bacterium]|nr:DUF4982 domain-containing protein [Bacteroidaceae bacterium]
MKKLFALLLSLMSVCAFAQVSFGNAVKFNEDWRFVLADDGMAQRIDYDDSRWRPLMLPHDWSIEEAPSQALASCTGYLPGGIGWYRKHFTVADESARHYIYFEGIYNRSDVYINGHHLGHRPNGYVSFMYDLTPYLNGGDNVIAVRVDHSRYADSRWYTGSGIYRDVYLVSAPEMHLSQWGVAYRATKLTDRSATIEVDVAVDNHTTEAKKVQTRVTMLDAEGKQVASASRNAVVGALANENKLSVVNFQLRNPHRWTLENPYLYTLRVELLADGKVIDKTDVCAGLRTLEFDADTGFVLNGVNMKVKGVCLHHDAGVLGAAVPPEVWRRRIESLKAMGANAIRMSHNPQAPIVYDLCDELGMLVMDEGSDEWEFPKRKWLQGWNKGEPGYEGTADFFEEWIERDITDIVRRDRNHPSVFLWSVGNEVDYPNDPYSHPVLDGSSISQPMFGGYDPKRPHAERIGKIAKRLAACIRAIDASRPVTGALAGVVMSNETEYPEAVDVVGYNYTEDRYDTDHAKYPNRIIYGSETRSDFSAWKDVRDKQHVFGQFIWTGTDYLGESGAWPSRGLHTGLLNFANYAKPRGKFREAHWSSEPMIYIGTYRRGRGRWGDHLSIDAFDLWNYREGERIRVVCYTNTAKAQLKLNGEVVGDMKPYDDEHGMIYWDIPYASGTLTAEGYNAEGNLQTTYTIKTSGRPYALRASLIETATQPHESIEHPTYQILVEVLDEEGTLVKLADNMITCHVEGPARLLGLENSDNSDMSHPKARQRRVYQGTLVGYVQRMGDGLVTVTFSTPLLGDATIEL